MTTSKIIRLAKPHYSAKLAYHNFRHPVAIKPVADKLVEKCQRYGVDVNEEAIDWAIFYHDAEFGADYRKLGFYTPEELSASAAIVDMNTAGVKADTILTVAKAIEATNWAVKPESVEDKILRAADLAGLAGNYSHYFDIFDRLMIETGATARLPFFFKSSRLLANYLSWRVELTPEYWDETGKSAWHKQAMHNILVNYFESCGLAGTDARVILDIEPEVLPACFVTENHNQLIIGIEPRDDKRIAVAYQVSLQDWPDQESRPVELLLPGSNHSIPLPDGVIDQVCLRERQLAYLNASDRQEMARVMRNSSTPLSLKG